MPEYVLTPEKKELPSGPALMEELHRRGFPVEITLKGPANEWESVRFFEPGPPEVECLLSFNPKNGSFTVTTPTTAPHEATEMQLFLVDILLKDLGGMADNTGTRERYSAKQFAAKVRSLHGVSRGTQDLVWIAFSWIVTLLGVLAFFLMDPQVRHMALIIAGLSLLSAAGQTYSYLKS
jgi:hypothetical protein